LGGNLIKIAIAIVTLTTEMRESGWTQTSVGRQWQLNQKSIWKRIINLKVIQLDARARIEHQLTVEIGGKPGRVLTP
jgi:hypothetical protein